LPPLPLPGNLSFDPAALGWLRPLRWFSSDGERAHIAESASSFVGFVGITIALGHSVLAMSGEETLAQVNRELEHPKLKNLQKAGWVIFIYSLLFTSLVSFFAVAIIPAANIFDAVAQMAEQLDSSEIVAGLSSKMSPQEQARSLGRAWERLTAKPRRQVCFRVIEPGGSEHVAYLGAHAPHLSEDDINLIHKLWLQVSNIPSRRRVHHRDVVRVALKRLERDLCGQSDVMLDFYKIEQEAEREK
jgi:hypothetical protein